MIYNKGIRNTVLYREDELNTGDLLMVAKNNEDDRRHPHDAFDPVRVDDR